MLTVYVDGDLEVAENEGVVRVVRRPVAGAGLARKLGGFALVSGIATALAMAATGAVILAGGALGGMDAPVAWGSGGFFLALGAAILVVAAAIGLPLVLWARREQARALALPIDQLRPLAVIDRNARILTQGDKVVPLADLEVFVSRISQRLKQVEVVIVRGPGCNIQVTRPRGTADGQGPAVWWRALLAAQGVEVDPCDPVS